MSLSKERNGRATSGKISKIAKNYKNGKFLKPAITYIEEKKLERKLKRSLDGGASSRAIKWGNLMEQMLFLKLGLEWSMTSKLTIIHPDKKFSSFWCGTPDLISEALKKVGEIKCFQLKHFCQVVDIFNDYKNGNKTIEETIALLKYIEPELYWQTVSNAMLLGFTTGEMIVFAPNETMMEGIRDFVLKELEMPENVLNPEQYKFIIHSDNNDLAVLPDDCDYEPINSFEFKIPMEDQIHLTKAMIEAGKLIEND